MGKNKYNNDYERMINNATYRRLIPGLIKDHEGGWIVISKGELIGIYKTRLDAINAIKTHDLLQTCNIISPNTSQKRKINLGFGRKLK